MLLIYVPANCLIKPYSLLGAICLLMTTAFYFCAIHFSLFIPYHLHFPLSSPNSFHVGEEGTEGGQQGSAVLQTKCLKFNPFSLAKMPPLSTLYSALCLSFPRNLTILRRLFRNKGKKLVMIRIFNFL